MSGDSLATTSGNRLLRIQDVAEACSVSHRTVRRWVDAGDLSAYRLGRQLRIRESELAAFIERNLIASADEQNVRQNN